MKENHGNAPVSSFPCVLYESGGRDAERLKTEYDWHEEPELIYFKSGRFLLTLNMEEHEISEECLCFINAGVLHKLEAESERAVEYSLRFHPSMLEFLLPDEAGEKLLGPLREGRLFMKEFVTVSDLGYLELMRTAGGLIKRFREVGTRSRSIPASRKICLMDPAEQLLVKAELLKLIGLMSAYGMLRDCNGEEEDRRSRMIKRALSYIRENYHRKIYVRDLAELTELNEQYFIRFFGELMGITPLDYINRYRIERAKELLLGTERKGFEVAEACGFHNIGNFIKIFRTLCGMTPGEYRKRSGEEAD